jgi:heme exporter protein A
MGAEAAAVRVIGASLAHHYGRGRGLLPVSFEAAAPGMVAVVGPNGAGKSTLLRMLAGLLRPTGGTFRIEAPGGEAPRIGYAASDMAFYEEFTVEENLRFAAEAQGIERSAVAAALERVELTDRARDKVGALSSGLKQRVRIAFALLDRPHVLMLDEPGSHLDDRGRSVVFEVLDDHRRHGLALVATNDEREWRRADSKVEIRARRVGDPA